MPEINREIPEEEQPKVHKPYSKFREKENGGFNINFRFDLKRSLPYFIVVLIFCLSLYMLFLFFDGILMPHIVHDREMIKMPDLTGKPLEDGISILKENNLHYKVSSEMYSEEFPPQTIVKQAPYPNAEVKVGRTVYITLSIGEETVAVPYLVGLPLNKAKLELMKRGLQAGEITYDFSEVIPKDSVMSQSVNGGLYAPYGDVINLVISQGSNTQIPVPVLIGFRFEDVAFLLSEQGFELGSVSYRVSETFTPNTVIEQYPAQSELAPKGSAINIVVSK